MMMLVREALDRPEVLLQLKLALSRALNREEKNWGYFKTVRGSDGNFHLDIPSLPSLKFVQNPDRYIYKLYWGRAEKPSVYTRKKKKTVTHPKTRQDKIQRTYEVLFLPDGRSSVRTINRLLATEIRDRIAAHVSAQSDDELEPLVLLTEAN
ncbi:hypothetical protein POG22_13840 [Geitlerinema sp. CS-897]|nr:hypothetical protein [Geitlerinema sp. CS-897]